jgi:DMSO/TMAO reductase YedYZ molybdopterin-dependent catalytic subunit
VGGRRTNLALLAALVLAFATGWLAFGTGTRAARVVLITHSVAGVALLVLARAKGRIVRRGLRRRTPWGRALSVAFLTVVLLSVLAGLAHVAGVRHVASSVTAMQVHVGAAFAALPLLVLHYRAHPVRPRATDASRRALVQYAAVTAVAGGAATGVEILVGADRRFTGSLEVGSGQPARMPVTQWLFDAVPRIDAQTWRLLVTGRSWSLTELDRFEDDVRAVIDCTGGWYAAQEWAGVRLDRLLLAPPPGARSLVVTSVTGYRRRFPLADASALLVATRVAGAPLSAGHGYPARLVAPGRRGFWWVKWIDRIDVDDAPAWRQPPFPLQ